MLPKQYRRGEGIGTYDKAVLVITALLFVGQVPELRARERVGDAIRAPLNLAPEAARRLPADVTDDDAALANFVECNLLRVRSRQSVLVGGAVINGRRSVDGRMTAGEPVSVKKSEGHRAPVGTINGNGNLARRVAQVGADTVLDQIAGMVAGAGRPCSLTRAGRSGLVDPRTHRNRGKGRGIHRLARSHAARQLATCNRATKTIPDMERSA